MGTKVQFIGSRMAGFYCSPFSPFKDIYSSQLVTSFFVGSPKYSDGRFHWLGRFIVRGETNAFKVPLEVWKEVEITGHRIRLYARDYVSLSLPSFVLELYASVRYSSNHYRYDCNEMYFVTTKNFY